MKGATNIGALLTVVAAVAFWALTDLFRFATTPLPVSGEGQRFVVPRGSSLWRVTQDLVATRILDQPYYFVALASIDGTARRIQAGEYEIRPGITPRTLLDLLVSGRVLQHSLTVVEGWTFRQVREALASHEAITTTLGTLSDAEVMARLGRPGESPEGRFLPDTYHFPRGTTDAGFLERAYLAMQVESERAWRARSPGLPLKTPYEVLILASIVEKETGQSAERAQIAGVFIRRLLRGMRLQSDPTVIYGLGNGFDGNLRKTQLLANTPHNTYLHEGLPPTPIALPGRASIWAVVRPAEGSALYFVSRGDGSHEFSATLAEHNEAVRRFQLGGRAPSPGLAP